MEATTEERADLGEMFESFFAPLFEKTRGEIELRCLPSRAQLFTRDETKIIDFIDQHLGENIYFGVCTRRNRDGTKEGAHEIPALWADVDFKDFDGGEDEALRVIEGFPLKPSRVIRSGHGFHLYWILTEPMPANLDIERYLKGVTRALRADPAAAELARVLRVPGSFNRKGGEEILVTIERARKARYSLEDFEQWKADASETPKEDVHFSGNDSEVDLESFDLSEKILNLIRNGWHGNSGYRSRSEADEAVICALLSAGGTPDEIRAIFYAHTIGDKYREKGSHADSYLAASIASAKAFLENEGKAEQGAGGPGKSTELLPVLDAGDRDLESITRQTLKILVDANDPAFIFRHADTIARIQSADDGTKIIKSLTEKSLRNILAKVIDWQIIKKKKTYPELPPKHVCENILVDPEPPFPILTRIVHAPVFAPDGTLVTLPGYGQATKLFYDPEAGFKVAAVSERPSTDEIAMSVDALDELLIDFPFTSNAEKAHTLALLVQPFARELIDGATPLFLVEKPSPGTGASLLADVVLFPSLGRRVSILAEGRDDDEWRKRLTSKLVGGASVILIDNIRRRLESGALSAAITAATWEDRMLGHTQMVNVPVRCTWVATGNNPAVSNEIARRTIRIRLDAKTDRPWLREGFKHANLRDWALENRPEIVHAALTLVRGWIAQGRPEFKTVQLGMFESWSRTIGGILEVAGIKGFLSNLEEFYEESDAEAEAWRAFIDRWWQRHGVKEVGIVDVYPLVSPSDDADDDPIDLGLGDGNERSQKIRLGKKLVEARDRQFGGFRIVRATTRKGKQRWQLKEVT